MDRERESMLSKHEDELRQYDIGVILQLDQKVSEQQVAVANLLLLITVIPRYQSWFAPYLNKTYKWPESEVLYMKINICYLFLDIRHFSRALRSIIIVLL